MSLLPSATEIVFALGRGDELVGVTFECDFPPAARDRRIVSTSGLPEGLSPGQIDAVVSARIAAGEDLYRLDEGALSDLDPDVVLTQDLCAVCAVDVDRVDDALAHLGCAAQVVTLDPHDPGCGPRLHSRSRHRARRRGRGHRTRELAAGPPGQPRPRRLQRAPPTVLVLEWTDPPFSAGHWVPDLVSAGGGRPVMGDPGADSQRLNWDAVATAVAEVVIVAPCGYHLGPAYEHAAELVADRRLPDDADVWAVDADSYFVRPGPRLVDGAELVGQILHPELCGSPDPTRALRVGSD